METQMTDAQKAQALKVADLANVGQDVLPAVQERDPVLVAKAQEFADMLVSIQPNELQAQQQRKDAVEAMGLQLQREAANRSGMLREPIRTLATRGEDGGPVANTLVDLRMKVEELDPGKFDFEAGWVTRLLGWIPWVGTPMKRYFMQFESAQTVIDAIIRALEEGKAQLERDNRTLAQDQVKMREITIKLQQLIALGQLIQEKLEYKLEREIDPSNEQMVKFVKEELMFPLLQRIQDMQQQLVVNQQGVLATEVVMRNNKELIRGVNRALNVTVTALEVAVAVAIALANQKITLEKINALNKTTDSIIADTSKKLRTQGVEIHKQASSTALSIENLQAAFNDIKAAMDDISSFRQNALPQMADQIIQLDKLTGEAEETIQRMEQGNAAQPMIVIDVNSDTTPVQKTM